MAVVGSAYVEIHAIMAAVAGEIRAGLTEAMAGQGEINGARFGREFGAAAEASLAGPLTALRGELSTALNGAAAGVSELTAATINQRTAQADLAAATRAAIGSQQEYTAAVRAQAAAQADEVAVLERTTVAHQQAAAARLAAAQEAAAAAYEETAAAQSEAAAEAASTNEVTAAQARATAARTEAALAAQTAAEQEVVAARAAAAGATEAAAAEVAAAQETAAARVAAADAARASAAAAVEAAAAQEAAATRAAAAAEASAASATRGTAVIRTVSAGIVLAAGVTTIAAVKMAGDFQAATERLVTSAGETQANLDGVRAGILALTGQVGYSAEDLAAAMYKVESGGQHGADGLLVLKAAAQGAKTENADLTTVSDALTSALTDYHLPASAAADVTSKLVAATAAGKLTFQDLSASLSAILPIASANHVSLNDVLGDLASMTLHGISAQQASQNLADTLKHMAAPTAVQAKELAALGINSQQLSEDLGTKGLSGTLQEIAQRIQSDMGPGSTKVIVDLQTALAHLPPQVQELGKKLIDGSISLKDYTAAAKALDPISAAQANQFKTLATNFYQVGTQQVTGQAAMQSYTDALRRATGDATGLNVALMLTGENSGNTDRSIKAVSDATAEAGGNVKGWAEIQDTFNVSFSRFKDGLGAGAIALGTKLLPALTGLLNVIISVTDWFSQHQGAATALSIVLGVVLANAVGILAVTMGGKLVGAIRSVGAAFLLLEANPVVLAITAIIVVVYLLITHWQEVSDFLTTTWSYISDLATSVWTAISSFFVGIWNSMVSDVTNVWNGITSFFSDLWTNIQNIFTTAVNAVSSFLQQWGPTILAVIAPVIGIPLLISQNWDSIVAFFQQLWTDITDAVSTGVDAVVDFFTNLPQRAVYALGFLIGSLVRIAVEAAVAFGNAVVTGFNATVQFFVDLPQNIFNALSALGTFLVNAAVEGSIAFGNAIVTGFNATVAWFQSLPGIIGGFLANLWNSITAAAATAATDFGNAVVTGFNATVAFFASLPSVIGNYITGLVNDFLTWGTNAITAFGNGIVTGWNATVTFFTSLPSVIGNFFSNAGDWLLQSGLDILTGLINGLTNGFTNLMSWLGSLVDSFVQGFKDGMGISSPSTLFAQFGGWIIEGLVNGLNAALSSVIAFIQFLGQSMVAGFQIVIDNIVALWSDFWNGLNSVASTVFNAISSMITTVWNQIQTIFNFTITILVGAWNLMWNTIFSVATTIWNNVSSFLTTAINVFVSFFTTTWNNQVSFWTNVWNTIVSVATSLWNNISSFLTNAVNSFINFFTTIWNNEVAGWRIVWSTIQQVATTIWNAIQTFLTNAVNAFINFFTNIWNATVAAWRVTWAAIQQVATTVWNAISSFLTTAINTFNNAWNTVWNAVFTFFTDRWNAIKASATTIWNAISSFFTGAFNTFTNLFNTVWNNVQTAFTNVWNGIKNVATSVWDGIVNAVRSGVNRVIDVINGITGGINVVLNFVGVGNIGSIPHLASGGILELAAGDRIGGGFKTRGAQAIVGEGNPAHPEYVIPTDPQFKDRAVMLYSMLGQQLKDNGAKIDNFPYRSGAGARGGPPMMASGGIITDIAAWIGGDVTGMVNDAKAAVYAAVGHNVMGDIGAGSVGKIITGADAKIKAAYAAIQAAVAAAAAAVGIGGGTPAGAAPTAVSGNQAIVKNAAAARGWTGVQWDDLYAVIMRESGFRNTAQNPTSTAYGMFQFLDGTWAGYGGRKTSDPTLQTQYGLNYIASRYGNPAGALAHEQKYGWYDEGGWLPPGLTLTKNDSGVAEAIIPDPMTAFRTTMLDVFSRLAPELSMAISAGSRDQARQLATQLELNPDRLAAIAQAVSEATGSPVADIKQSIDDLIGKPAPTPPPPPQPPRPPAPPPAPSRFDLGERIRGLLENVGEHLSGAVAHFVANIQDCSHAVGSSQLAEHVQDLAEKFGVTVSAVSAASPGATQAADVTHGPPGGLDNFAKIPGIIPAKNSVAVIPPSAVAAIVANYGTKAPAAGSAAQQAAQAAADAQVAASNKNPVIEYPEGAFQVHVHGNADSVTVKQLQTAMSDFGQHILSTYRGKK